MEKIGKKIRELRKERKYTMREIAEKLDIDQSYLSKIENGKRSASLEILEALSTIFDVNITDFFAVNEEETTFIKDADLDLEELMKKYNIVIDGHEATEEEIKEMLDYIRFKRLRELYEKGK